MAAEGGAAPTDYVRIKRKQTTIFAYIEQGDTIHDLRAKVNHVTKVPTTDMKFFIDKDGEVPVDEMKSLAGQKVRVGLPPKKCCGHQPWLLAVAARAAPTLPPFSIPASHTDGVALSLCAHALTLSLFFFFFLISLACLRTDSK